MLLKIKSNHGDGTKCDSTVIKMGGNKKVGLTFTVESLFPFVTTIVIILLSKFEIL